MKNRRPLHAALVVLLLILESLPLLGPPRSVYAQDQVYFQAPSTSSGLSQAYQVGDGVTSSGTVGGQAAIIVSPYGYAYFNVSDSFMLNGNYTYAAIQVEYYDGSYRSQGDTQFYIEYDSSAGLATSAKKAYLNNTGSWKTYTFYLSNVYFGNRLNTADFRVSFWGGDGSYLLAIHKVTVTRSSSSLVPSYASASNVSFQSPDTEANQQGLYLINNGDGHTTSNASYGRTGTQVSSSNYAYLDVDDSYIYQGNHPNVAVAISFYDSGTGRFIVQYDAATDTWANSTQVLLGNSSTWVTRTVYLSNAYLGTRQNNISDLRIVFFPDGTAYRLVFDRVVVTRDVSAPDYSGATSVSFQAPSTANGLTLMNVSDGVTSQVTQGGRSTIQVSSSGYAYFDVDNTFMYQGNYKDATIEVSYFDQGYGFFYLQTDSNPNYPSQWAADSAYVQSFNLNLQSNNVFYLTNTSTWLTATFNLSHLYFGNRQLVSIADFRIVYPLSGDATTANMGYLLAFDRVVVTRSSNPLDRSGRFEGNYRGYGDPEVVWVGLGQVNDGGHGLWQYNVGDGASTSAVQGGEPSRINTTYGYLYFDVNDNYILNGNAYNVYVTVDYFDNGSNIFWLEYDATGQTFKPSEAVGRSASNTWKKYTFYLSDAYFGNRLNGGTDIRITAPQKDLYVKAVYVMRASGPYVRPRGPVPARLESFSSRERVVASYFYPGFDYFYPSLMPSVTMAPTNPSGYSWRSVASWRQALEDMKAAKIDIVLPWYLGSTASGAYGGVQQVKNLVAAAQQVSNPPKIGLFVDTFVLYDEGVMKPRNTLQDIDTASGRAMFFKYIEDFYSQVPYSLWALVDGRPLIVLYSPAGQVGNYNAATIQFLVGRFQNSFGMPPYLVADINWDADRSRGIQVQDWFAWSAALYPSGYAPFQNNTASVGPGFNDGTRVRAREGGAFYSRSWDPIIGKGMHLALIETWNYAVEGTAIYDSQQYGRQYITATASYAQSFKGANYTTAPSATITLGPTNTTAGIYQHDAGTDGQTVSASVGGLNARRTTGTYMYFSVHDSFSFNNVTPVSITVKYWDANTAQGGVDSFVIQYDGGEGAYSPTTSTEANTVLIKDRGSTQTWKTRTFTFNNAIFGNRELAKNDFRLVLTASGTLYVSEVSIALAPYTNKLLLPIIFRTYPGGW